MHGSSALHISEHSVSSSAPGHGLLRSASAVCRLMKESGFHLGFAVGCKTGSKPRVNGCSHFVYRLKPETDGEGATALFVARWEDYTPVSAVVVIPDLSTEAAKVVRVAKVDPNGGDPRTIDLRQEKGQS